MKRNDTSISYEQMGMAALLPGMVHMLEVMQRHIDDLRAQLGEIQQPRTATRRTAIAATLADAAQPKRRGRPPLAPPAKREYGPGDIARSRTGWPLDPEERKREMARRNAVKMEKRAAAAGLKPRDKGHPRHEEWRAKMSAVAKRRWANMSATKRKAHMALLRAGWKANGHATEAQA